MLSLQIIRTIILSVYCIKDKATYLNNGNTYYNENFTLRMLWHLRNHIFAIFPTDLFEFLMSMPSN